MKRFFLVVLVLAGVALCSCVTMNSSIPLVPPDPNLPEIKAFLGKWEGVWYDARYRGSLVASLEIIKNEEGDIDVTYFWEDSQEWRVQKGSIIKKLEFYCDKKGKMVLYFGKSRTGTNFEFHIDDNGNLRGRIVDSTSTITMHPVSLK